MNIAFINPEYPSASGLDHGGIATYIYTIANALCKAGHHVHVLARKGTIPDTLLREIAFHTFDHAPLTKPFSFLSRPASKKIAWEKSCSNAAYKLIMRLHHEKPLDIVEIPEYNGLATCFVPPLPFKLVVTFHTPTILIDEWNHTPVSAEQKKWYGYEKKAIRNAAALRCPSHALANKVKDLLAIPNHPITVIGNPIDTEILDAIYKKDPTSSDHWELLFSGRLERRKGAELISRSINDILAINKSIRITFAGETEMGESANYRQAIERSISKEQRDRIWFLGPLQRDKLSLVYRRSDIFLMPSIFENAPYALLEAMAAGLPVIGTDTSGISEIITHNVNGLLFRPDNPEDLCACIRELITNDEKRKAIAVQAHAHIQKFFRPEIIVEKTIEFYSTLINNRPKNA